MRKLILFLLALFLISFTPLFGAMDRATIQWFLLSIIPFFFINSPFKIIYFKNTHFYIYLFFIIQVFLSLIYTNNLSISLVDLSRHLTAFALVIIFISLFKSTFLSFYYVSLIISLSLLFETLFSLKPLFNYIYNYGFNFSIIDSLNINQLRGVAGNRNITTASIAIKFPFLLYSYFKSKSSYKPLFLVIALLSSLSLFLINSRAALLSFSFFIFLNLLFFILLHRNQLIQLFLFYGVFIISYFFSVMILPNNSSNALDNIKSIKFTSESSNHRFFLWENAVDFISNNLFIGCGIGNWKVESALYWSRFGKNYLVPFHAHNDFLEFATELGILGGLTYLILFLFILYNFSRLFYKSMDFKYLVLFLSFLAISIDSALNFPFERPLIQIMFILLLSLSIHYNTASYEKN